MANRCALTNQIETLSGALSAATYFDANWNNPVTALNDASLGYINAVATDTGSANNYLVTCPFGSPSSYNPGMQVDFIPANTNTGSSTLTVSPLTAASILDNAGNPLTAGAIQAGIKASCVYIAGNFRLGRSSSLGTLVLNPIVTVAGTTTLNVGGYANVNITIDSTTAPISSTYTLLLNNVYQGAHLDILFMVRNNTQSWKFSNSCTDSGGNTIVSVSSYDSIDGNTNLITTALTSANWVNLNGGCFRNSGTSVTWIRFLDSFG